MPVRFKAAAHSAWVTAQTVDIGTGGAFIASPLVQSVGTPLTLELTLNEQMFTLPAVVRWTKAGGMGVQFVGVDVDVLLELNDYFATLT